MKNYIKNNKKVYDQTAKEYENRLEEYKIKDKKILQPFFDALKNSFNKINVLELGPGSGLGLFYCNQNGFKTTAIDISKEIIKVARSISPDTKFICDNFLDYNFENLRFEGILAKAFVHLFPKEDTRLVFKKIKDLLLPKGIAFISTTLHEKSEEGYLEKKDYLGKPRRFRRNFTEQELLEELKETGFDVLSKYYDTERGKSWIILLCSIR